jgi:hypothetical protein
LRWKNMGSVTYNVLEYGIDAAVWAIGYPW